MGNEPETPTQQQVLSAKGSLMMLSKNSSTVEKSPINDFDGTKNILFSYNATNYEKKSVGMQSQTQLDAPVTDYS